MKARRSGFTLVELLTVIVIIAMLAGMITGAVMSAVASVNQTVIRTEIDQMALALQAYKNEFGEFPPDGTNSTEVTNHIKRCYKNATSTTVYTTVTPENALVIFLGPHNANPKTPFTSTSTNLTKGFYEFDKNRVQTDYSYLPRGCAVPYVYFKAKVTGGVGTYADKSRTFTYSGTSCTVPCYYYTDNKGNTVWYNDKTFQIISAGLDNVYSNSTTAKQVSSETDAQNRVGTDDFDNIVNFGSKRIKDLLD